MPEESKEIDQARDRQQLEETLKEAQSEQGPKAEDGAVEDPEPSITKEDKDATPNVGSKKKSKKKKLKDALSRDKGESSSSSKVLDSQQLEEILKNNPALRNEVGGADPQRVEEMLKKLSMSDLLTGMAVGGKNQKDMGTHKFWQTQPVPSFQESGPVEEGPIKTIDPEQVPKEPPPFIVDGFNWVTMDLNDEKQLEEVYELLSNHYVEDEEASFRFKYSNSFLNWALKAPGWTADWHVGVRASQSGKLVAFISGIPISLRVRKNIIQCSEINFLCIHKKLRSKRLAPILIKEITRRCYRVGTFQAIYTAGIIIPKPVASCRYYHRSLNWEKLYEVGFSPLPTGSTKARQISKFKLPPTTSTHGLRPMQSRDVDSALDLLNRYLDRADIAQKFSREDFEHWLLQKDKTASDQVVWSYVVEDPNTHSVTDFISFYCVESTAIGNQKYSTVKAAYLYYYATETAFSGDKSALKNRLNALVKDALIVAKKADFDVMNALTLLDNPLFLEEQKFGPGDGQLHYYLYNYRTAPIASGVNGSNQVDERFMGGVGVVML